MTTDNGKYLWYSARSREFFMKDLKTNVDMPVSSGDLMPEVYDFRRALTTRQLYFRTEDGWVQTSASMGALEALAKEWGYHGTELADMKNLAWKWRRRLKLARLEAVA
jgi:hypothetical protein